jgi:putative cell wall-binding protein/Leucine-rich repeat (LRR) protein
MLFFVAVLLLFNCKPTKVNAATEERIWGQDRYQTASMIAFNGWKAANYAILVTGENYPDALAATPLSKKYDAPILLTEKNKLSSDTLNTLRALDISEVFIIGGTGVISTEVYNMLIKYGYKVKRIAGANRYETSLEIAKLLGVSEGIFVVDGGHFGDALTVGPVAASLGMPIILTDKKSFDSKVEKYLQINKTKKSYVISSTTAVSESVVSKLSNVEIILGNDIYERNKAVLQRFRDVLNFTNAYITTGSNFPDALAGGALASKNRNPLILTAAVPTEPTTNTIKDNKVSNLTIVGGEGAVATTTVYNLLSQTVNALDYNNLSDNTDISKEFVDETFKKEIYNLIRKDSQEPILYSDVKDIIGIDINGRNISSLDGIEYFSALEYLYCYNNQLTSLDVSRNSKLTDLSCGSNRLTSLDLSKNPNLTKLGCGGNQLTVLDISDNTALTLIDCIENKIEKLDISNNTELTKLFCDKNRLKTLDLRKNPDLTNLNCSSNQLLTLDVSKNNKLDILLCDENSLTSLDLKGNPYITMLHCDSNQLRTLDVSENIWLREISCRKNSLTTLDVSKNTELFSLNSSENRLTALDMSSNTKLVSLDCTYNQLTTLNVSKNTVLGNLSCGSNKLTTLNISSNTDLRRLVCDFNQLTALDVSKNINLAVLNCNYNKLTKLDVSNNIKLIQLSCSTNKITTLDLSNNSALTSFTCFSNQLTELDLSKNKALTLFDCQHNQIKTLYLYTDKVNSGCQYREQFTDSTHTKFIRDLVITIKQ